MPQKHRTLVAAVALTAALAAGAGVVADASSRGEAAPTERMATAATQDFRVVLTAARSGGDAAAPTAAVTATTWRRADGRWRRTGVHRLRGPYFWHTVTGGHAVCRLELRTAGGPRGTRPRVAVQVLLTPSIGCGPLHEYRLGG